MDINHIVNYLHTPTNNFPTNISNNNNSITSTNLDKELSITMDDHNHHHHHHHEHQHHNNHVLPHISFIDQAWPTYHHNLPTPHPSPPPSSYIIKSSIQDHIILLDEDEHHDDELEEEEELGAMKEMMYRIASMQPVDIDPSSIRKPKRRNVRISNDPQSVAARHRRERISEKIRILQRLVPGGTKMDTASMLDEAIRYVKFLKRQIRQLQAGSSTTTHHAPPPCAPPPLPPSDWALPPPSASVMGLSTSLGSSKLVLSRDSHLEGLLFQHGGN